MNIVDVVVLLQEGCCVDDDEYSIDIVGFIGSLDIQPHGEFTDCTLIKEAIDEAIHNKEVTLIEDEPLNIRLIETGEWDDVFYNKYYELMPIKSNDKVMYID